MTHSIERLIARALVVLLALGAATVGAEDDGDSSLGFERTPPRLSFTDGEVSYWRPGDEAWSAARVNTALAAGDELATGAGANLELQVGARAWLRAGEATELAIGSVEPDYLQIELLKGTASLDVRELGSGQTFRIETPKAAFTIERPGYYRLEVTGGDAKFTSRRGGHASVQIQDGLPSPVSPNEQVVVSGADAPVLASYGAPSLDDWDRWNYSRSERQSAPVSARHVPAGVYGADDLDAHGTWRAVPSYGSVWVPRVAVGWTPYSTGRWVADPYYGWTWVDDAPWGWAPFHYGRWVHVGNYWAWSPGPRVRRAYYSPALVAFYSGGNFSVGVSVATPYVGWVALGWGEPVIPWWGPRGCKGRARWAGWGGPRYVNNVVIKNHNHVNVKVINNYQHYGRKGAMVAVERGRFGRGHVRDGRIARVEGGKWKPARGGDFGVRSERAKVDRRGSRVERSARGQNVRERNFAANGESARGARGGERARTEQRSTRDANQRQARVRSGGSVSRAPRADLNERRGPVSRGASARGERSRERSARPAAPTQGRAEARVTSRRGSERQARPGRSEAPTRMARAEPNERRVSASSAARAGRERARDSARERPASRTREQTARRSPPRVHEGSPRARGAEPRASAPPRSENRARQQSPRLENRTRTQPSRSENRARPQREMREPRAERAPRAQQAPRMQREPRAQQAPAAREAPSRRERAAPREKSDGGPEGGRGRRERGEARSQRG